MSSLQKPQDRKRMGRGVLRLYKKIPCIKLAGEKVILLSVTVYSIFVPVTCEAYHQCQCCHNSKEDIFTGLFYNFYVARISLKILEESFLIGNNLCRYLYAGLVFGEVVKFPAVYFERSSNEHAALALAD